MAMGKVRDKNKEAFWRRTVRRQGQSGLTVRAFCREHELRETAFYFWRCELARRQAARPASAAFVPVQVVETPAPARSVQLRTGGRIEIVLSGGRRVHVAAPVDRQALADVLAVLSEVGTQPARTGSGPERVQTSEEAAAC
jgi:hypothetical protein